VVLARYQFPRAPAVALGTPAAHETPMVQEEPQQVQIRATQVTTQREVVAQSRVEVLDKRTAARRLRPGTAYGVEDSVELAARLRSKPVQPCQYADEVLGKRCSTHASRTTDW
jgi:hypothetical protein